ncbi:MAG: DUF885 domain-containing protein [candidate division Zixibacteria bacterium]|nr:DUF885 domain-containing protein [candidate division Zixibacteria bacterium]
MTDFNTLTNEIIDYLLESSPVWATCAGVHDYDHQLDRFDHEYRQQRLAQLNTYLEQLHNFESADGLSPDEELDRKVLLGSLKADILTEEDYRRWERDPSLPLDLALYGSFTLAFRDFAPREKRFESLVGRLQAVPQLLSEAVTNLQNQKEVPTVWAEMAEERTESAIVFFGETIPALAEGLPTLAGDLKKAAATAVTACHDYLTFLRDRLTTRSKGAYSLGPESFEKLLESAHALSYSAADLAAIGQQAIVETIAEMDRLAKKIDPDSDRLALIEKIKRDSFTDDALLEAYRREVAKLRRFVIERDLVTIPPDDDLPVMETPEFSQYTLPFAAYVPPAPFDRRQQALFWVTPVDQDAPPEIQQQQRQGHNKCTMRVIALHEAYPGHHLQFLHAGRIESRVRRLAKSPLFTEGWAFYCEELLYEEGFYGDDETRLMQLVNQLVRACRVVIDVGLHTGEMSFTDAVNMLVEQANMDRFNAIAEVKRYSQSPTQPMSYLIGKKELLQLKAAYREKKGDRFRLKEFHDRLLSFGTIPIRFVRDIMLEQN